MNPSKPQQSLWQQIKETTLLLLLVFAIRTWVFGLYQVPTGSMETTLLVGERFFADKLTYNFRTPQCGEIISMNDPEYPYSDNKFINWYQRYVGMVPFVTWGPTNFTKRIIATPGQTVKGVIEDGKPVVYVDGKKIHEPYLNKLPLIYTLTHNLDELDEELLQDVGHHIVLKTFDPNKPFNHQPYYKISPKRALNLPLEWPGTPLRPHHDKKVTRADGSHWNGTDEFEVKLGNDEYWGMGDNRLGSRDCRSFGPIKQHQIHGRIVFRIWSIDSDDSWWFIDLIKHPIKFWKKIRWSRCLQFIAQTPASHTA